MNINTQIAITAVAGLSVGVGIGYLVADKRLKTKYEALAEDEIDAMREHYQLQKVKEQPKPERKAAPTEEELNRAYSESILQQKLAPSEETIQKVREIVNYSAYSQRKETEEVIKSEDPRPQPEFLDADNDINKPYVISVEMYMANDELFDQINLTYYAGDNVLADDADRLIDDVEQTVGVDNLTKFGEESQDPSTVYVRNEKREVDFEIILDSRKFGEDILGMTAIENHLVREPKPRPKKFRDV